MRFIMVRHGDPDYANDCLTELGRKQAAAAAQRLAREGIEVIYSSSCGRALETARATADRLGLAVRELEFMREIRWRDPALPLEGHPWKLAKQLLGEGYDFFHEDWRAHPYFQNRSVYYFDEIAPRIDQVLAAHGYRHEGRRFFCTAEKDETVALFSHGGSGGCVLAHLLDLPLPYAFTVLPFGHTSITIVRLPFKPGEYVAPRLALFNETEHTRFE